MRTSDALPPNMCILSGVRSDKNLFAVCTNARLGLEAIIPDTTAQAIAEYNSKNIQIVQGNNIETHWTPVGRAARKELTEDGMLMGCFRRNQSI